MEEIELTVSSEGSGGCDGGAAAREALRKVRDLIPGTEVPPELDMRDGLEGPQPQARSLSHLARKRLVCPTPALNLKTLICQVGVSDPESRDV